MGDAPGPWPSGGGDAPVRGIRSADPLTICETELTMEVQILCTQNPASCRVFPCPPVRTRPPLHGHGGVWPPGRCSPAGGPSTRRSRAHPAGGFLATFPAGGAYTSPRAVHWSRCPTLASNRGLCLGPPSLTVGSAWRDRRGIPAPAAGELPCSSSVERPLKRGYVAGSTPATAPIDPIQASRRCSHGCPAPQD